MFKKLVISLVSLSVLALVSCKKNYTCECTTNGSTSSVTYKETKKNAEKACDALNAQGSASGTTCKLK